MMMMMMEEQNEIDRRCKNDTKEKIKYRFVDVNRFAYLGMVFTTNPCINKSHNGT